jgi:hypothetical protein
MQWQGFIGGLLTPSNPRHPELAQKLHVPFTGD